MAESVSSVAVVIGPTAAGKTAVAMALQDLLGGPAKAQLISADQHCVPRYGHRYRQTQCRGVA